MMTPDEPMGAEPDESWPCVLMSLTVTNLTNPDRVSCSVAVRDKGREHAGRSDARGCISRSLARGRLHRKGRLCAARARTHGPHHLSLDGIWWPLMTSDGSWLPLMASDGL